VCVCVRACVRARVCVRSPEWPVVSLATQNVLTLVLVLTSWAHCFWHLIRTLESERAVVTKTLFTLMSTVLLHFLQFSKFVYVSAGNGERTKVMGGWGTGQKHWAVVLKEKTGYKELKVESWMHSMQTLLWKRLWACHKTGEWMDLKTVCH